MLVGMAIKKRATKKSPAPGVTLMTVCVPRETHRAMKARVDADTSVSSLCREVLEAWFGVGRPAPEKLETIAPGVEDDWARFTFHCPDILRERGTKEMQRRATSGPVGRGKPRQLPTALAWLLVQRFGPVENTSCI